MDFYQLAADHDFNICEGAFENTHISSGQGLL